MCGFTGFIERNSDNSIDIVNKMIDKLYHRGPDDKGIWADEKNGIFLAHRRLSILDLSPAGHQPMISHCGRYVIVFNGEIYNHKELRTQLPKISWRGHSDTETLLASFSTWGIEETITKAIGMFAIAVWDKKTQTLSLIRDRAGEKPLYYGWQKNTFLFGSELKALRTHPSWLGEIDRQSLALFLRHNYIPAPWTIFSGIFKLLPATILTLSLESIKRNPGSLPQPRNYWSFINASIDEDNAVISNNEDECISQLECLLRNTIHNQMLSDVPIGAFLSGGIDSSLIVSLMQKESNLPVKTFSIGFNEDEYNEAQYAKAVAKHLNTEHTDLYVSESDARAIIPDIPCIWDEPFSDSSQIPTLILTKLTKKYVTVALSGDGGDELFGGYVRYFDCLKQYNRLIKIPNSLRFLSSKLLYALPRNFWSALDFVTKPILKNRISTVFHKIALLFDNLTLEELYRCMVSHWYFPEQLVINFEPATSNTDISHYLLKSNFERLMLIDFRSYLPDDILVKVDRSAMAVSLETRTPFLDHRIVEFSSKLPISYKIRNGQGKWILKQLLKRHIPCELIDRPKKGFGVPLGKWLRGSLRDWAENLLSEDNLKKDGLFYPEPIRKAWLEHLSGYGKWEYRLWDILMFQAWMENEKSLNHVQKTAISVNY